MPTEPLRVLLVVDQPADARRVSEVLGAAPDLAVQLTRAERISSALALLRGQSFDVVLVDLGLPDSHGVDGIERMLRAVPALPVLVLAGTEDLHRSRAALQSGAEAVLVKEALEPGALSRAVREAIVLHRLAVRLAAPGTPSETELAPLRHLEEGVAVVARGKVIALNEVGARLLGEARASDPSEVAELFAHTLSGSRPPGGPHGAPRAEGTVTVLGELRLLREDGSRATSRYLRRVLTLPHGVHALIRIAPPAPETEIPAPPPPPPPPPAEEPAAPRPRAARPHRTAGRRARTLPGPAIEPKRWAELQQRSAGTPGELEAQVARFLNDGSRLLHALRDLGDSADAGEATVAAGRELREAAEGIGALRLAQACGKLEQAADAGDPSRRPELVRAIGREFERTVSELRTLQAPEPTG